MKTTIYYCNITSERVLIKEVLKFGLISVINRSNHIYNVLITDLQKI